MLSSLVALLASPKVQNGVTIDGIALNELEDDETLSLSDELELLSDILSELLEEDSDVDSELELLETEVDSDEELLEMLTDSELDDEDIEIDSELLEELIDVDSELEDELTEVDSDELDELTDVLSDEELLETLVDSDELELLDSVPLIKAPISQGVFCGAVITFNVGVYSESSSMPSSYAASRVSPAPSHVEEAPK